MDNQINYMLLGRYQRDVEYYLGWGCRNAKIIDNPQEHIQAMRELYNSFPEDQKPQWLTMQQINEYERITLETQELPFRT